MASASTMAVNPDLQKERDRGTVDVEKLTHFIDGGPKATARRRYLQNMAIKDLKSMNLKPWAFRTREEQYDTTIRKQVHVVKRSQELGLTTQEINIYEE